jgi:hypothetical protein
MATDYNLLRRALLKDQYGVKAGIWCVKCKCLISNHKHIRYGVCADCLQDGVRLTQRELDRLRYGVHYKKRGW